MSRLLVTKPDVGLDCSKTCYFKSSSVVLKIFRRLLGLPKPSTNKSLNFVCVLSGPKFQCDSSKKSSKPTQKGSKEIFEGK